MGVSAVEMTDGKGYSTTESSHIYYLQVFQRVSTR